MRHRLIKQVIVVDYKHAIIQNSFSISEKTLCNLDAGDCGLVLDIGNMCHSISYGVLIWDNVLKKSGELEYIRMSVYLHGCACLPFVSVEAALPTREDGRWL